MQWLCHMAKSLDESPVMTYQAQKGLDFSIGLRCSKFCHSFQIFPAGLNTFLGYVIGQITDLTVKEFAFTWLEFQVMLLEALKHNMQALQMLLPQFWKRQSHHPSRLGNTSSSTCLGNSALTSGRLQGHHTIQRACIHT